MSLHSDASPSPAAVERAISALRAIAAADPGEQLYDVTPAEAAALLAELSALRAEREWRPIESAPKDGTSILAWFPDWGGEARAMSVKWIAPHSGWSMPGYGGLTPPYWQPLPAPPTDAALSREARP